MGMVEDLAACDRETGLHGSLADFARIAWPVIFPASQLVWNWHMDLLCDHYEAVFRGEIPELVVNVPPGMSKSSLTCVIFPAWGWIRQPASRWIFGSYGQKLVRRDAETMVRLMRSDWWKARWGDRFGLPTVAAIERIENTATGFRLGTTPGAEVTGWHANYQVIDDPQKPEDMTTVGLDATKEWYQRTMSTRWMKPPQINGLICIMQRLHCGDLAQYFLDSGAMHICLPAEFDPKRRCITPYGRDPRMAKGELLDAMRLPATEIVRLKRNLGGINAAAQLDQNPVPEGGAVFKHEGFRFWSVMPAQFDQVITSWDCAFKDEKDSDFVCGMVWGRIGANFYLLDRIWGRLDFTMTLSSIQGLAKRWPLASTHLVEDKANGTAVINTLASKVPGLLAVDPHGGKFSRASATSGFVEAHNVWLPDPKLAGYEWVDSEFLPEVLTFPRSKNDDQVDCMTQALLYLNENTNYLKEAMEEVRKQMMHW